jgi:hypothetical protein
MMDGKLTAEVVVVDFKLVYANACFLMAVHIKSGETNFLKLL